jgi:hypothetical protein
MHAHVIAVAAVTATATLITALRRRRRNATRDALRRYYTDEALVEARRRIAASEPYRVPVAVSTQRGASDTVELVR